MYKQNGIVI